MLKGLITSIFPPKRFARWSSCTLDGTCFDLSLHVDERERLALWRQRHDRCTLRSGSLSFTSRGLINQKEALLPPSLSLSPRHSRLPLPRRCVFVHHRALSSPPSSFGLHLHLALSLFLSYMYMRVYIYISSSPSKRQVSKRGGGAPLPPRIRVSFAAVPREAFGSRCRVCRKHRGSGHSLSRSGSRVQLCRRRGN